MAHSGSGTNLQWELAKEATEWSLVTSAGFLVASVFISVGMHIFQSTKGNRNVGGFAIFMILLEMVDAIPEAAVLAQSTITGSIGWSFVISILMLNIVNTSASCVDFLATSDSKYFHRFLFLLLFFCVGMLSYSISTDVYGRFAELFKEHDRDKNHLLVLVLGTLVGFSLIILIMKLEHKIREKKELSEKEIKYRAGLLEKTGEIADDDDEDDAESAKLLEDIYKEIMDVTPLMEKLFEQKKKRRRRRQESRDKERTGSRDSVLALPSSSTSVSSTPGSLPSSSDNDTLSSYASFSQDDEERGEYFEGNVADITERVGLLNELSVVLKVLHRWKKQKGNTPLVEETNSFVRTMVKKNMQGNMDDTDDDEGEGRQLCSAFLSFLFPPLLLTSSPLSLLYISPHYPLSPHSLTHTLHASPLSTLTYLLLPTKKRNKSHKTQIQTPSLFEIPKRLVFFQLLQN
jgi:hypothetical protein